MGTRESQRRAWREAVARAAEELRHASDGYDPDADPYDDGIAHDGWVYRRTAALDLALSAPKPWTRPAKADLGKWRQIETLRRDTRIGPSGMTFREFCRRGYGAPSVYRAMDYLRRKRRAAQRRRR